MRFRASSGLWEAVPPWRTNATSGSSRASSGVRTSSRSSLRRTCPYYSDWRGSFEKLPWATDDEALRAANADVAIVGAPLDDAVSSRPGARFGPRAIRMAPTVWSDRPTPGRSSQDVEPYGRLKVVDAGDAPVVARPAWTADCA